MWPDAFADLTIFRRIAVLNKIVYKCDNLKISTF